MQLRPNTFLQGSKYKIEKVLGQGGFGITYLGTQMALNRKVAIKEFFMKEYCERNSNTSHVSLGTSGSRDIVERFRTKFIKEAQTIAEMDNNHIIRIYDVFEENGTAYYVMEYLSGGDLSHKIPRNGMSEAETLEYICQVGEALSYIHAKNILHLDIKPTNILFRENGNVVLIDFGVSKHYDDTSGSQTSSTPVGISEGYAPTEQYDREAIASFAPSTDVYSLGATLYCLLCGTRPPKASVVLNEGLPALPAKVSDSTRRAVEKAMSPRRKDRPQSVKEFLALLDNEVTIVEPKIEPKKTPKATVDTTPNPFKKWIIPLAACVVVALAIILWPKKEDVNENEIQLTESSLNTSSEVDTTSAATITTSQTANTEEKVNSEETTPASISHPTKSETKKEEVKKEPTGKDLIDKASKAYSAGNYDEAVKLYKKAAEQGYAKAQYLLGYCYYNGEGVAKNPITAMEWITKAAENSYTEAQKYLPDYQYNLGYCYLKGEGVAKDPIKAVEWMTKAAENGNAEAQKHLPMIQYNLGYCYLNGEGVAKDPIKAVEWMTKAAENGNAEAQKHLPMIQYNLGYCYLNGEGVTKNLEAATTWFKKAADQGYSDAINALKIIEKQNTSSMGSTSKDIEDYSSIPVREERVRLIEGRSLKDYGVVCGSFGVLSNAKNLMTKLQFDGYAATIVQNNNNIYRVLIESYSTQKEAARTLHYIKEKYSNDELFQKAWLLHAIK